jgi:hypothetical protein
MANNLFTSLSALQSKVRTIPHDSKGHGYTYASLDRVWDAVRQPLHDAGLAVAQIVEMVDGRTAVRTVLAHCETGEKLESVAVAPSAGEKGARMSPIQAMGSEITYLRRYGMVSLLGLTSDADVDGAWMEMPKGDPKGCTLANPSPRVQYEEEQIDASIRAGELAERNTLENVRAWCEGMKAPLKACTAKEDFSRHKAEAIEYFGTLPEMIKSTLDTAYKVWAKSQTTMDKETK